jgi:hypothetical protein
MLLVTTLREGFGATKLRVARITTMPRLHERAAEEEVLTEQHHDEERPHSSDVLSS